MTIIAAIGLILLAVAALIFLPIVVIWALNTLFALGIAFTFKTWLATLVLSGVVYGSSSGGGK